MSDPLDPYKELGVATDADHDVIEAAWHALLRKYHPDTFEGDAEVATERTQRINAAHALIGTPENRRDFDRTRAAAAPPPPRRGPRISVARYFGRRREGDEPPRRFGLGAVLLVALTMFLLGLGLSDVERLWDARERAPAEGAPP